MPKIDLKGYLVTKGGPGSGHHGHAGRPGKQGGSAPGKGGGKAQKLSGREMIDALAYDIGEDYEIETANKAGNVFKFRGWLKDSQPVIDTMENNGWIKGKGRKILGGRPGFRDVRTFTHPDYPGIYANIENSYQDKSSSLLTFVKDGEIVVPGEDF